MPSTLETAIARNRRRIEQREAPIRRAMRDVYRRAVDELNGDLDAITRRIRDARASGEEVNPDWLRRQDRYVRLIGQVERQFQRFSDDGLRVIQGGRLQAVRGGAAEAWELMDAAGMDVGFNANINTRAVELTVAALGDDTPVRKVLDGYGANAARVIEDTLEQGIVQGTGPREIVRQIRRQLLDGYTRARLDALCRSEMMRAYRGSLNSQYATVSHLIQAYRRTESKSPRTCLACVYLDGHTQKTPHTNWHICCRGVDTPVAIDSTYQYETGEQWFAKQSVETQQAMMPSSASYEAFAAGDIGLKDFVQVRRSRTWGTSIVEGSGRRALEGART